MSCELAHSSTKVGWVLLLSRRLSMQTTLNHGAKQSFVKIGQIKGPPKTRRLFMPTTLNFGAKALFDA